MHNDLHTCTTFKIRCIVILRKRSKVDDTQLYTVSENEPTLKTVSPFYLVSMPGEEKDPTEVVNVSWTPYSTWSDTTLVLHDAN